MTWLKVKGVKRVVARGRVYYYHRRTMQRIEADPADAAAFAAAVARIDAGTLTLPSPAARPRTLGDLIRLYRASPEFQTSIGAVTRKGYDRAFDAVASADGMLIARIDQPWLIALRDGIHKAAGRWLANYAIRILSIVLGWGVPRGHTQSNPAQGIPKIRRRKGEAVANKAWTPAEVEALIKAAQDAGHVGIAKAVALGYYAGLRKTDVVATAAAARQKLDLVLDSQSKTGRTVTIIQARRLRVILDLADTPAPDDVKVPTIVRRRNGRPYTADGLDSLFHRHKHALATAGTIRTGLTFHGLRKSLGKRAADLGFSENDIAGALGHSNPASARVYTVEAARERGARRVFKALERKR